MMARGQYFNQPRMASPGRMRMAMEQQHAPHPHMVTHQRSYNPTIRQQVPHSSMSAHQIVRTPPQYIMQATPLPPRGIGVAGNVMGGSVRPFQQLSATVSSQQKPFLTQPPHPQQTLSPMDQTHSPFSLQPAASSSAPQNQTQQPPDQQTWPSEPVGTHGTAAHLNAPASTSQLQPQEATQSGSFMVSWSLAYVMRVICSVPSSLILRPGLYPLGRSLDLGILGYNVVCLYKVISVPHSINQQAWHWERQHK